MGLCLGPQLSSWAPCVSARSLGERGGMVLAQGTVSITVLCILPRRPREVRFMAAFLPVPVNRAPRQEARMMGPP